MTGCLDGNIVVMVTQRLLQLKAWRNWGMGDNPLWMTEEAFGGPHRISGSSGVFFRNILHHL